MKHNDAKPTSIFAVMLPASTDGYQFDIKNVLYTFIFVPWLALKIWLTESLGPWFENWSYHLMNLGILTTWFVIARKQFPIAMTKARSLLRHQLGEPRYDDCFPLEQTDKYAVDIQLIPDSKGTKTAAVDLLVRPIRGNPDPDTLSQRLALLNPWLSVFESCSVTDEGVRLRWLRESYPLRTLKPAQLTAVPHNALWWHGLWAFLVAPDSNEPLPQDLPIAQLSDVAQLQLCQAYCGPLLDQRPLPAKDQLHGDIKLLARLVAGEHLNKDEQNYFFQMSNQAVHRAATAALNKDPERRHHLLGYHFADTRAFSQHLNHLQSEDDRLSIPHLIACFHLPHMRGEILNRIQRRDDERVLFFFCDLLVRGSKAEQKLALDYVATHGDARVLPFLRRAALSGGAHRKQVADLHNALSAIYPDAAVAVAGSLSLVQDHESGALSTSSAGGRLSPSSGDPTPIATPLPLGNPDLPSATPQPLSAKTASQPANE